MSFDYDWKSGPDGGMNCNSNLFEVADPMALYDGFNRFNRIRDLNRNRNFPIDHTYFVICYD